VIKKKFQISNQQKKEEVTMVDKEKLEAYWKENKVLTTVILIIWFVVSYGAAFIVNVLNKITISGFPFGYYMGAQGSIAIFVILIFYYAARMNKIDKKYGFEEEE
jgi:putative solute:sodium symporter small subunit